MLDQEINANIIVDNNPSTHGEITSQFPSNDGDINTTSEVAPHGDGNSVGISSVSPPQYSSTPPRYSGAFGASV